MLLVNPVAGRGRAEVVADRAEALLRAAGRQVQRVEGRDAVHAAELAGGALERPGVDGDVAALVAVGGDGLVHLAVQVLAGTDVPLGVVPAGTGNDVARALDLPRGDVAAAVDVVLAGRCREVDLGCIDGVHHRSWFASVLACGFDARVNDRANRMRRPRGRSRYTLAMLVELGVFRPLPFALVLDGQRWDTEAMLVAVGNGPSYGGGMRITPDARLDDGVLDLTVLLPVSRPELLRIFPTVFSGRHVRHPRVVVRRARAVRLAAPDATAWADGELVGRLPLHLTATPRALRVLTP